MMSRLEKEHEAHKELVRLTAESLLESSISLSSISLSETADSEFVIVKLPLDISLEKMLRFLEALKLRGLRYHTYDDFEGKMASKAFKLDGLRIVVEWPDSFGLD